MDRGRALMTLPGENKTLGFDIIFKQLQMPAWEPEGYSQRRRNEKKVCMK